METDAYILSDAWCEREVEEVHGSSRAEKTNDVYIDTHLRSPKSPNPGIMYAFSLRPSSIQPVICAVEADACRLPGDRDAVEGERRWSEGESRCSQR